MIRTKIEFRCTNGHTQIISYNDVPREFAIATAKLVDDTSEMYRLPPGEDSIIGKCGLCKAQLTSRVVDDASGDQNNNPQPPPPITGS